MTKLFLEAFALNSNVSKNYAIKEKHWLQHRFVSISEE